MLITSRHLIRMGATPEILAIYRRSPILITWRPSGYTMDGVITARALSASQVLRFIAASRPA